MANELCFWSPGGPPTIPFQRNTICKKPPIVYSPESRALQQCKNEINTSYQEGKWDDYKKITNPYEYIFLSWNRRSSRSVATRQPLSRSYFKMIELWNITGIQSYIHTLVKSKNGFTTAHAAEGPGGFIEACSVMAAKQGWTFQSSTAITLRSEAKNVPGWRKAAQFLLSHPQVHIYDGVDETGNILHKPNQDAFVSYVRSMHPDGVMLYTADGGFDFSSDYNAQEDTIFPLLLAEVLLGLRVLMTGGCLIIKCFDTLEKPTQDLIWLLSRAFCEWGIVKPCTSRAGNAERYIVGKGFLGSIDDILAILEDVQQTKTFVYSLVNMHDCHVWKKAKSDMYALQEKIEHHEINIISQTLQLINHIDQHIIHTLVHENVQRSITWCAANDEPINDVWKTEIEKNVTKETNDLLRILKPSIFGSYSSRQSKNVTTNQLSFEGFRSARGIQSESLSNNPFMRPK